ncbi:TPA: hypothetical protein RYX73_004362 [Serratia marcescens]|jgi:hypothetical protein|nr:hypothetical protein [Serratia marcescens]
MNILGITTSPKSRLLFASDWTHHRGALALRIIEQVSLAILLVFMSILALMGVSMIAQPVLNGAGAFFTDHQSAYALAQLFRYYTLAAVFFAIYVLVMNFSRDYYFAAELGYDSVFDYDLSRKPSERLRVLRAHQQATQEGRNDA